MNILYVNFIEKISGGETSLLYYLEELKAKINPVVISPRKGPFSRKLDSLGIKNYTFNLNLLSRKNPLPFLFSLYNVIRVIYKEKIDLIHANGMVSNQLSAIASKITGRPLILHIQNFVEKKYHDKYFFSFANKIIVVSEAVNESLKRYLKDHTKIILLRHAVCIRNIPRKKFSLHKELKISKNNKLVALIGLLEERKGHEYFIRAAKLIKDETKFLIIGDALFSDNSYKNRMIDIIKELNLNNIYFLGYRTDILNIMKEIDILIVPSINEPLGVIVLEAGSVGIPVIGFNSGGIPEMIEDKKTGFLVPEKNYKILAKKIKLLLQNKKLRYALGKNARTKIEQEFNIKKNSEKILSIYHELILTSTFR